MKRSFLLCLSAVFLISGPVSAQIKDSLGNECLIPAAESSFSQYVDRRTSTKGYRMTFVAVSLILGGAVVSLYDTDFRRLRNGYVRSFHHDYDDYLQYAPAALLVGMKVCGVESRSSWGRMLVSDAFSAGLMAAAVNFAEVLLPRDASRWLHAQFVPFRPYGDRLYDGDDAA